MACDVVIRAEGLGKKYVIGHEARNERYVALRDVLARNLRSIARSAQDLVSGRQMVVGDKIEDFWALKGVNFEIKRGEVVGVIGRNGAGKSTLLKVLSRITEPSEGQVTIQGRVASLLEVGTGFHPELTGRENIFLNGAILGMGRAEIKRKFDQIVAFAGVERFLDTPVKRYSSGMYVRLAFAVAAHLEPEVLIIDEVLAVGDAEFQRKCLGKMQAVAEEGRTVLFVSHDMGAISQLCTNAYLLDGGKVQNHGDPTVMISEYLRRGELCEEASFEPHVGRPSIYRVSLDQNSAAQGSIDVKMFVNSPGFERDLLGGIAVRAATGEYVWSSNGRFHPVEHAPANGHGVVLRCRATELPLVAGRYSISVWLARWHADLESRPDVLTFQVNAARERAIQSRPETGLGFINWPAQWIHTS